MWQDVLYKNFVTLHEKNNLKGLYLVIGEREEIN